MHKFNISVFVGITNARGVGGWGGGGVGGGGENGFEMLFQPYNLMMKEIIIFISVPTGIRTESPKQHDCTVVRKNGTNIYF